MMRILVSIIAVGLFTLAGCDLWKALKDSEKCPDAFTGQATSKTLGSEMVTIEGTYMADEAQRMAKDSATEHGYSCTALELRTRSTTDAIIRAQPLIPFRDAETHFEIQVYYEEDVYTRTATKPSTLP
jgi:hypothetical protein